MIDTGDGSGTNIRESRTKRTPRRMERCPADNTRDRVSGGRSR